MYDACIKIATEEGTLARSTRAEAAGDSTDEILLNQEFVIEGSDFSKAGMVSTEIKSILKKIGFDPPLVRRVAISTYEGEMNVVMHAKRANVYLAVTPKMIEVVIDDEGKGIPDVEAAMEEGFTTATEEMRAMGFGSGMGLPNINRNSDNLEVTSEVGKGTTLRAKFYIK
jgi:anti-sigma regulatory factor (Ser/Thr protein kinase)